MWTTLTLPAEPGDGERIVIRPVDGFDPIRVVGFGPKFDGIIGVRHGETATFEAKVHDVPFPARAPHTSESCRCTLCAAARSVPSDGPRPDRLRWAEWHKV